MKNIAFVLSALLYQTAPVGAEELYDFECCPKDDCHTAQSDAVTMTLSGYHVESLDTVISPDDPRIRVSRDGQFHICTRTGATPEMRETAFHALIGTRVLKCLYVPTMS